MNSNRGSRLRARYGLVFLRPATRGGAGQRYLQPGAFVHEKSTRPRDRYGLQDRQMRGIKERDVIGFELRRGESAFNSEPEGENASLCAQLQLHRRFQTIRRRIERLPD